jgi:hypothetical protein
MDPEDDQAAADAAQTNGGGDSTDNGVAAPSGGPMQIAPGLWAGDFQNGSGLLGVRMDLADNSLVGTAPTGSASASPTGLTTTVDPYAWMRQLGDQGIAYQVKDGKISVYETRQDDGNDGTWQVAVKDNESFDPKQMNRLSPQDLSNPVYQDLHAFGRAMGYLSQAPYGVPLINQVQTAGIPTVMVPDGQDRFDVDSGSRGAVYWDPTAAHTVIGPTDALPGLVGLPFQSPAMALFHEYGHASHSLTDHSAFLSDNGTPLSDGYTTAEEKRTIDTLETPEALWLGEPTRTNHQGRTFRVSDPLLHALAQRR